MDPLVQAFFEEAGELLADFESGLLGLEAAPGDTELLNRIFRSAHTLKGNSGMLGFEEIAGFTHVLEDLLDQLRKGRRTVTPRTIDALLLSNDAIRVLLRRAQAENPGDDPDEVATIESARSSLRALLDADGPVTPAEPAAVVTREAARATTYRIEFRPPADLFKRGLDPIPVLEELGRLGDVRVTALTDQLPPLADLDPERCYLGWRIALDTAHSSDDVRACFDFVSEGASLSMESDADGDASVPRVDEPRGVEPRPADEPAARSSRAATPAAGEAASIRVPVEKVDRLINLVGELVITQSMVAQVVSEFTPERLAVLQEAVSVMDRHARELHERVMAVRMLPIKTLFGRFPRLVRDVAAAIGKQVTLDIVGEETELDKTVIEKIGDPLTHLVRNAIDHGLEPPADRRAAGKPEAGHVRLEAYQQGGSIYIEVADDGRGLDRDRILAKARANGLVTEDQALADEDIDALIFRPGFSTAERVTELSGRGVGMDVVKRNVEALSGSVTIHSTPGRGTTFKIKLPLTLAILDGQVLRVGSETYIIPLVSIVESIRARAEALRSVLGAGEVVIVRGHVLPVVRVHRLFGVRDASEDATQGLLVIVEHEQEKVALLVDELLGQQQVVIKSLETNFRKTDGVAGATILGDGRVALILDVPGLIALTRPAAGEGAGRVHELVG